MQNGSRSNDSIVTLLQEMRQESPAGFAAALHISFTSPRYLFQSYPQDWMEYYTKHGLVLRDPTVRWGFENTGSIRWSTLTDDASAEMMATASEYGLRFGVTIALVEEGSRTVASFARADREFADPEIARLNGLIVQLHHLTIDGEKLSPVDHDKLKQMSVLLTHPVN